jgi:hypothetical protein
MWDHPLRRLLFVHPVMLKRKRWWNVDENWDLYQWKRNRVFMERENESTVITRKHSNLSLVIFCVSLLSHSFLLSSLHLKLVSTKDTFLSSILEFFSCLSNSSIHFGNVPWNTPIGTLYSYSPSLTEE